MAAEHSDDDFYKAEIRNATIALKPQFEQLRSASIDLVIKLSGIYGALIGTPLFKGRIARNPDMVAAMDKFERNPSAPQELGATAVYGEAKSYFQLRRMVQISGGVRQIRSRFVHPFNGISPWRANGR